MLTSIDEARAESVAQLRRLGHGLSRAAVVVLVRRVDDERVYSAVAAGAAGVVADDAPVDELIETIREAAAGNEPISRTLATRPAVARRMLDAYALRVRELRVTRDARALTRRELEILELAARGMTNQQIGRSIGVSEHTIKSDIGRVLARLGLRHRTEAVVCAVRNGWIQASGGHEETAAGLSDGRLERSGVF